ncbi:Uncharacterised protein [uncultured archaeon]|nr:Uncharacterised protein [uncultured archaeon]
MCANEESWQLQSGVEYLITYGWSITMIVIVLGMLYELSFFIYPQIRDTCVGVTGFSCSSQILFSNGTLTFRMGQGISSRITVLAVGCSPTMFPPESWTNVSNVGVPSGGVVNLAAGCIPNARNPVGTQFSGTLWMNYSKDSAASRETSKIANLDVRVSASSLSFKSNSSA